MNPLLIDEPMCSLKVREKCLVIYDRRGRCLGRFRPREIKHDAIVLKKPHGSVSFEALSFLQAHNVNLSLLDWKGNLLGEFVFSKPIAPDLKIGQVKAYLDAKTHVYIAKRIVETKVARQRAFLKSLKKFYPEYKIKVPQIPSIGNSLRADEGLFAQVYFQEFSKVVKGLGFEFSARRMNWRLNNSKAGDFVNSCLNYSYSILKTYLRRAVNATSLEDSLPFLHDLQPERALIFDLEELWRISADLSVIQTLQEVKHLKISKPYYVDDNFEVRIEPISDILIEKLRSNLMLQELLDNCRILARYLVRETKTLEFNLKPLDLRSKFEGQEVRDMVLKMTARELKMNKSTHFYMRKRLIDSGTLRLYEKTQTALTDFGFS